MRCVHGPPQTILQLIEIQGNRKTLNNLNRFLAYAHLVHFGPIWLCDAHYLDTIQNVKALRPGPGWYRNIRMMFGQAW